MKNLIIPIIIIVIIIIVLIIWYLSVERKSIHELLNKNLYSTKFKESMFKVNNEKYEEYKNKGYEIMKKKKISFIGMAYNIDNRVKKLLKKCEILRNGWLDAHFVIYCYDSTDNTYKYLNENKPDWLTLPTDIIPNAKKMKRMERMSHLRNLCLKYIRNDDDYVMVVDWDLKGNISLDGIANSITYLENNQFDVLSANGLSNVIGFNMYDNFIGYHYYDLLAVKTLDDYRPDGNIKNITYVANRDNYRRGDDPIQVKSAFGGACLYKAELLRKYKYSPEIDECEHVVIHEQMHNDGYKIGINPSFILLSGIQGGTNIK